MSRMADAEAVRWSRMEELFHRASELPEPERAGKAREWCSDEPDLLHQLLNLLAADSLFERSLASETTGSDRLAQPTQLPAANGATDTWLGHVVGAFVLERELGRGGMGVVYLGRRIVGGFSQRVAVKLIARYLAGGPAVRQFELERDTLARLEHKNIARLLDGGVTAEGTPYVAMEYIEGQQLDQFCDNPAVSIREKLRLMLQLCDAVAYVHRNLILHRDLKPANVMVKEDGTLKLLDFGTTKLMDPTAERDSEMTLAGMRALTLRYASPEHIEGKPLTTAADVYSLGMILYRLLSGRLPTEINSLPLPEYLNRVQHNQFAKPTPRTGVEQSLAADLDAITLKAIRFEPAARYPSVEAFADDLQRTLEHRPVAARIGTMRYRAGRFIRRNRLLVAGSFAAVFTIALGVWAARYEASVARAQSRRADAGVEAERTLAHMLLFDYFEQLKRIPASTDAQRKAVAQALSYLDNLNRTSVNSELRLDSIRAYTDMGLLQGSAYEDNLGDVAGGIVTLRKAVTLAKQLEQEEPANLQYVASYVSAERALGQVYLGASDPHNALAHLLAAADAGRRMMSMPGVTVDTVILVSSSDDLLGDTYGLPGVGTLNDPVKALARYKEAQEADRAGLRAHPDCVSCLRGIAVEDWKLGSMMEDDPAAAEASYRDGLASLAAMPAAEQNTPRGKRMDALINQSLGFVLLDYGNTEEGLALVLQVRDKLLAALAADPVDARPRVDVALFDLSLTESYLDLNRDKEAMASNQEFLANVNFMLSKDPTNPAWQFRRALGLSRAGSLLIKSNDFAEGHRLGKESLAIIMPLALKPTAGPRILHLASVDIVQFDPDRERDAPMAVAFAKRAIGDAPHPDADQLLTLAEAQQFAGEPIEANAAAQAALKTLAEHRGGIEDIAQRARCLKLLQSPKSVAASH